MAYERVYTAAGSDEEDNAVCHNSASFLGVGNTQCLHKNFLTAVFLLAVIVAVSIGVDRLIHFIRGVIECPQLRRIVNRIFEEVMIMGFLSMVIFTLNTSGAMKSLALNQLTPSEQLHFYEFFHYIVFLTMIYFILIVLLLLFIGTVVPKLIWEIKKHPDRRESISDIHDYGDLYDPQDPSVHGSVSDREDSGSGRRMRHSFIRGVSSLRLDYSTAGSNVDDYERTLDTPSDDIYTGIQSPRQPASRASHTYRTMAMRARALSGMDLVRGSRAYSLLLQRYQREGWGFHFNLRKQWNLWKSFEVLAYNICQNRSGYIYKNPVEMERLFGVRPPPPPRSWSRDSVDIPDGDDGTTEMTYAKYHVLCMRNLLLHMTNIHPSAFLILLVICLLPSIFPRQDHWIFLGVGGLLLLVNVVIFFKVLKILRGIVDDRLRIITMRDIQKRLAKVLKDSDSRIRGRKKRHCTVSASDATPVSMSAEESSEEESNPADENLQSILQARRKKGHLKFKAAALAVRAVIHQDAAQSPASFFSTSCRTPRLTKMVDMNVLGPSMSWSQADVDTDALPDNNANGAPTPGTCSGCSSFLKMASILFVCLGNICRSPAAEAVLKGIVSERAGGDASSFHIDSCGTGGGNPSWYQAGGWSYHEGEASDSHMTKEAKKRGYIMTSRSRPLTKSDFDDFDYIICMEDKNRNAVLEAAEAWGGAPCKDLAAKKISMMTTYCKTFKDTTRVPDPWYEGGFDSVLDLLEDSCAGLYEHIVANKK
ncbi:hypothetical protein BBP00_00001856 [Phytophthora kernoviae]|uniref:Phosphotyrosine protein phosphatase I domain-containing protein n=1 Tax=Phytophthora kernoviae TaxID=325452 RepID=A0A3F2RZ20_9STRA|nr:hypothetical protein BBP00_00001856 [Phytophthora kernoviae]